MKKRQLGPVPIIVILSLVLFGFLASLTRSRNYLHWLFVKMRPPQRELVTTNQTLQPSEPEQLPETRDAQDTDDSGRPRRVQEPKQLQQPEESPEESEAIVVVDTMAAHWKRPANLSEEQRATLARKIQEYKAEPDRLGSQYGSEYAHHIWNMPENPSFPEMDRYGDYDLVIKHKDRILALIANPPPDPERRRLANEVRVLYNRINARHERRFIQRDTQGDPLLQGGEQTYAGKLVLAQEHLLSGEVTFGDVANVDSTVAYVHRAREFFRLQKQDIKKLFQDLGAAEVLPSSEPAPSGTIDVAERPKLAEDIQAADEDVTNIKTECSAITADWSGGRYFNAMQAIPKAERIEEAVARKIAEGNASSYTQQDWARIVSEVRKANQEYPAPREGIVLARAVVPTYETLRSQVDALADIRSRLISGQEVTKAEQLTVERTREATSAALQQLRKRADELEKLLADIRRAGLNFQ